MEKALAELGIELARPDLIRALNDPDTALAWCEVAKREARSNPGGMVVAGLRSGRRPSKRLLGPNLSLEERRANTLRHLVKNLGPDDGPDEARHYIDRVWEDLTQVERAGLHELVDELASKARFGDEFEESRMGSEVAS